MIGDFLQQLIRIIQWCWPFEIIRLNEQGVRKTFGKMEGPLPPDTGSADNPDHLSQAVPILGWIAGLNT